MKRLFMLFAMSIAMFSFAIERPSGEWNAMVTKCAFDLNEASRQISKLERTKQPLFAVDVMKAIILYPNPKRKILNKLVEAIEKISSNSDPSIVFVVQMMAIDAIPRDLKTDVIFLLNRKILNETKPTIVHQTPNGDPAIINTYLSTNRIDKTVYVPQSDIGVLRVPREGIKKNRSSSHHRFDEEPLPYWMQNL